MTCFILNHTIKKNNVAAIFWDESDNDTQILLEYNLLSFINTIFKFSYQIHTIISLLPHAWCFKSNFLKKEKIQIFLHIFLGLRNIWTQDKYSQFSKLETTPKKYQYSLDVWMLPKWNSTDHILSLWTSCNTSEKHTLFYTSEKNHIVTFVWMWSW